MKKHVRAMLCATIMSASCATVAAQPPVDSNFPPPRQTEYKIQTPTRMADYFDEAGEEELALVAVADSTPSLGRFDMGSDNSKWRLRDR